MARNNIDREFSEKLAQREIKPSEMAWDRLDAMLTIAEHQPPKRNFTWLYIAASFLGIALLATFFFNDKATVLENTNQVVQQENTRSNGDGAVDTDPVTSPKQQIAIVKYSNKENQPKSIQYINQNQPQIAQNSTSQNQDDSQDAIVNQSQFTSEQPKADELLALAQSNSESTPKRSVNVNAKNLLTQVDGEGNKTFRQRVLQKVGRNYQNVKVALANRNIEDENH